MSKTLKFIEKYRGQIVDVEPGWGFPGECVSLVQRFIIEELGVKAKARGNGKDWRTTLINEGLGKRVERKDIRIGDIIAWDGKLGHVAIALGGDKIFEQVGGSNKEKNKAHIGSIAYWDRIQPSKGVVTRLNDFVDEIPKKEVFKPYQFKILAKSYLYRADGTSYPAPTSREHTVTILEEDRNLNQGRFKASWLQGVDEAWVKLSGVPQKPQNQESKPKPVSNVGKTWRNILNPLPLYDGNGNRYKSPSRATRSYTILAEKGDYYQIQHVLFNPSKVWVKKIDGKLS